jgi:RHS repeat-associated protein
LTASTGDTKATYGYTAFGKDRTGAMTGADKPGVSTEPYNLYRFNAKRWDAASGDYDMGFRTYNPGLNRFTSRDMYNGALGDLNLGTDPWNTNRYTYAGGNPISRVELDGHMNREASEGGGAIAEKIERCPDCQLKVNFDGSWDFDGDGIDDPSSGGGVDTEAAGRPLTDLALIGLGAAITSLGAGTAEAGGAACAGVLTCPLGLMVSPPAYWR